MDLDAQRRRGIKIIKLTLIIFQMSRRNYTEITIVMVILFFDVLVYKYQGANCSNVMLPRSCARGSSQPRPREVVVACDIFTLTLNWIRG